METPPASSSAPQYVSPSPVGPKRDVTRVVVWSFAAVAVAAFGFWYFDVFDFGISRSPAAEFTPAPTFSRAAQLTARCEGAAQPRVVLSWTLATDMERLAILRFIGKEDPISIFSEPGPRFSSSFTDIDVQPGMTYHYVLLTGIKENSNTVIIDVTDRMCNR